MTMFDTTETSCSVCKRLRQCLIQLKHPAWSVKDCDNEWYSWSVFLDLWRVVTVTGTAYGYYSCAVCSALPEQCVMYRIFFRKFCPISVTWLSVLWHIFLIVSFYSKYQIYFWILSFRSLLSTLLVIILTSVSEDPGFDSIYHHKF
jgi:hypothetical protein